MNFSLGTAIIWYVDRVNKYGSSINDNFNPAATATRNAATARSSQLMIGTQPNATEGAAQIKTETIILPTTITLDISTYRRLFLLR